MYIDPTGCKVCITAWTNAVVAIVVLLVLVDCVVPTTPELTVVVKVAALVALVAVAAFPVVFWFSVGNVQLAKFPDEGVPKAGVTNVGLVANTLAPVPVSSVKTAAKLALDGVAKNVATLEAKPLIPVLTGSPVQFVKVPLVGVPKTGVTKVGLVDKTLFPEPVELVTPVPPLATGSVPVTPVVKGKPVTFVITPLAGVPSAGVTNVGLTRSAFVATAIAILANSVLISVPLRIFRGSPDVRASLVAKFVDCV
jgi:hypothetical protein